jgi:hypothetical protein
MKAMWKINKSKNIYVYFRELYTNYQKYYFFFDKITNFGVKIKKYLPLCFNKKVFLNIKKLTF